MARQARGRIVLRIEDIDSPRIKPGAAEAAIADLQWLGLDWDVGPIVQTQRLGLYESALVRLQQRELVYPCTCSRSDVEQAASAPHSDGAEIVYTGACTHRKVSDASMLNNRPFAWRFRVDSVPEYDDLFRGPVRLDREAIGGDFVVWKSQGTPAYQLAVVVDDADNGVTMVVRGDDLVSSTPRQLLLYAALELEPPQFAHVPLVVGPDGRRLAKRHGDTRLSSLRADGVGPERIIGLLAWSCGWQKQSKPITACELIPLFDLHAIPQRPFVVTDELLADIGYSSGRA